MIEKKLLPDKINNAIESFSSLNGVGYKTAFRFVIDLLKKTNGDVEEFAKNCQKLVDLKHCSDCGFFIDNHSQLCEICTDDSRYLAKTICVVEELSDLLAIEQSGQFKGLYHILGGVINPLLGVLPEDLAIDSLLKRCQEKEIEKVVLAINSSVEGDATCSYLKEVFDSQQFRGEINRIGFGIPMGSNLQYLDPLTIKKALENSQHF